MSVKIVSVIVTFYPEKELLQANISRFIDYVDKVLIWENTPEPHKRSYRFLFNDKMFDNYKPY